MTTGLFFNGHGSGNHGAYLWGNALCPPRNPPSEPFTFFDKPTKAQLLGAIADPRYSVLGFLAHGIPRGIELSGKKKHLWERTPKEFLSTTEVQAAMKNRPPFRLVLATSCYSMQSDMPEVLTDSFNGSAAIICDGTCRRADTMKRIRMFIDLINNPANQEVPLHQIWKIMKEPLTGARYMAWRDPWFQGDESLTPSKLFSEGPQPVTKAMAVQAALDYFADKISKEEALNIILEYFGR